MSLLPHDTWTPEMWHAAYKDSIHLYQMQNLIWMANSTVRAHDQKYGDFKHCEYCLPVHMAFMENLHKQDSTKLFADEDTPVKPTPYPHAEGPITLNTNFGQYVSMNALPPEVQADIQQRASQEQVK
jgi:hypothetical protein